MNQKNAFGLEGQVCVITGAASGIGRGIAVAFAQEGARLALLDIDAEGLAGTIGLCESAGTEVIPVTCDSSSANSVEAARATVEDRLGIADALVNNAGIIGAGGALLDLSENDWNRLLSVNLTGYFLCSKAFGRPMAERGSGALVHVVSITSEFPLPYTGNYGVAKAGAAMLSRLLAAELGPRGVRSNSVHPGLVKTTMTRRSYEKEDVARERAALVPQGRVAGPEDIAQAALFLASPRAGYVNGADLLVDGGLGQGLMGVIPR